MVTKEGVEEIKNHLDTTAGIMAKAYSLKQLSLLDGVDPRTVKNSGKYIPVRFDNRYNRYKYLRGEYNKSYTVKYIRVDEIKYIFRKRNKGKMELCEQFL